MADNKPMPLKDLPGYIQSVREHGQGGDSPVVEMGRIVSPNRSRQVFIAVAACLFLALGGVYVANSTNEIEIEAGVGSLAVAEMVSEEGGRVLSVVRDEDGNYRVRVFTFGIKSLVDRLREKKEFESVEMVP